MTSTNFNVKSSTTTTTPRQVGVSKIQPESAKENGFKVERAHSTMFTKTGPPPFAEKTIQKLQEQATRLVTKKRPGSGVKINNNKANATQYQTEDVPRGSQIMPSITPRRPEQSTPSLL